MVISNTQTIHLEFSQSFGGWRDFISEIFLESFRFYSILLNIMNANFKHFRKQIFFTIAIIARY